MKSYLLDTNHVSVALKKVSPLRNRIVQEMRAGHRFGVCVPVLCEMEAGIAGLGDRREAFETALRRFLAGVRIWPMEPEIAPIFGSIYQEMKSLGRALSQVDLMLAAFARQRQLILLTADHDFSAVSQIQMENWLIE